MSFKEMKDSDEIYNEIEILEYNINYINNGNSIYNSLNTFKKNTFEDEASVNKKIVS